MIFNMEKAVFFDRDGTIIEEKNYLSNVKDVKILDGVIEGLALLKAHQFLLILVSNQSGVGRGFFGVDAVNDVNHHINTILKRQGVPFDGIYFCPHYPSGIVSKYAVDCDCRKPKIKMALMAKKDFNIDLQQSYMIGDKDSDIEFGRNFNAAAVIQVATGYGAAKIEPNQSDFFAENCFDAANWIIKKL